MTEISTPASFVAYLGCLGRARPATKMDECAENAKRVELQRIFAKIEVQVSQSWLKAPITDFTFKTLIRPYTMLNDH